MADAPTFGFLTKLTAIHFNSGPWALIYLDSFFGTTGAACDETIIPMTVAFKSSVPAFTASTVINTQTMTNKGTPVTDKFWYGPEKITTLFPFACEPKEAEFFAQQIVGLNLSAAPAGTKEVSFQLTLNTSFVETLAVGLVTVKNLKSVDIQAPTPYAYTGSMSFEYADAKGGKESGDINYSVPGFFSPLQNNGGVAFGQVLRANFNPAAINGTITVEDLSVTLA